MDPFLILRYLGFVLRFWLKRLGPKTLVGLMVGSGLLAVVLNYVT